MLMKSRIAAPVGDVTNATVRASLGISRFRALSKSPSASSRRRSASYSASSLPSPSSLNEETTSW